MTVTELLESVRRVEVRTNRLVNDTMGGAYLSGFKGRGMDFEDLREYMPGDDVRDIDWNVTHRLGRPFVKRFREERELTAVLAVDVSASSRFGSASRTKREFAAEIAATLAMSAAKNGDKVALLLFTDEVELFVPPRKGRRHILRIVREMLMFKPRRRGLNISISRTIRKMCRRPLRGGTNSSTSSVKSSSATLSPFLAADMASVAAISAANSRLVRLAEPKRDDADTSTASTAVSSRSSRKRFTNGRPRRCVTFQSMSRTSSPGMYSRRSSKSMPRPLKPLKYAPPIVSFTRRFVRTSTRRTDSSSSVTVMAK